MNWEEKMSRLMSDAVTHGLEFDDTIAMGSDPERNAKLLFRNTFLRSGCYHCKLERN